MYRFHTMSGNVKCVWAVSYEKGWMIPPDKLGVNHTIRQFQDADSKKEEIYTNVVPEIKEMVL